MLRAKPEAMAAALAGLPERQRQLDLTQLHSIVLDRLLGLDAEKVREQTNLRYLRDAQEAVEQVRKGEADVAFLTNPVTMEQLKEVAFAGEVMPQKSTDFLSQAAQRPGHLCAGVSGCTGRMRKPRALCLRNSAAAIETAQVEPAVGARVVLVLLAACDDFRWRRRTTCRRRSASWWCWTRPTAATTPAHD